MSTRVRSRTAPDVASTGRRRLGVLRHRSTTANVCSLYPATIQAPLPAVGPLLGSDLSAGEGPLCWDPFEVYNEGLVTNPNVFVMGEPGFAKSSLIKCWAYWQHCLYGSSRWLTFTDPKGEYHRLAERVGMSVVRLVPGGDACINPLDLPVRLSGDALADEQDVQTSLVVGLAGTLLGRSLSQIERKVIRSIVVITTERTGQRSPTLHDVIDLLASPTAEMCAVTRREADEFVRSLEDLRYALDELCTGPLRGMFDGHTTVDVDWDGPGMVLDLSGVIDDERAMSLVMVSAMGWSRQQRHRLTGRQVTNVNDESYYMYKRAETVEFAQARRKLGRQFGEANIDICHRPSDLDAQADDGSKMAKIAHGLLKDSSMKIVFRQSAGELDLATTMLGLTDTERSCLALFGRGKALWKIGDRSLIARHHRPATLTAETDTDTMMRRRSLLTEIEQHEAAVHAAP